MARGLDGTLEMSIVIPCYLLVQALLLPGYHDTQCGFKAMRGIVARELFAELRTDGFAFDVEVLWMARRAGYRVEEIPVSWFDSDGTRVDAVRHSLEMLRDVLRIRLAAVIPARARKADRPAANR